MENTRYKLGDRVISTRDRGSVKLKDEIGTVANIYEAQGRTLYIVEFDCASSTFVCRASALRKAKTKLPDPSQLFE